ncbi:MAG: nicotinate (nicotinamide) nucleotide adenylyltransferase [Kiritimatiellae bacterium]|nr:nicotinate (nicotinamide) nucleotide adenylyltransferase [Kiritimatiellia bacterium]
MQTKIGVLGGTFNPVHMGHLILAQDALEQFGLSKVLFVPCGIPPHKPVSPALLPVKHRLAMLETAIAGDVRFEISDIEARRRGASYSVDTIRRLRQLYRGAGLVFIVGSDTLPELHTWKDIAILLDLCEFGVIARPGFDMDAKARASMGLKAPWPDRLLKNLAAGHTVNISSSDIRYRIAEGMRIRYLVHPGVEMYITEHALYQG